MAGEIRSITNRDAKPERLTLTNLSVGIERAFQFNPTQLAESIEVMYSRRRVPGLSHQPLQFVQTGNRKLKLAFFFHADTRAQVVANLVSRRFLQALCIPRDSAGGATAGASRVLLVWPNFLTLTCVLMAVNFTFSRFHHEGWPLEFTAECTLEEVRDVRWFMEDALYKGSGEKVPPSVITFGEGEE